MSFYLGIFKNSNHQYISDDLIPYFQMKEYCCRYVMLILMFITIKKHDIRNS